MKQQEYITAILKQLQKCKDIELLALVLQLLRKSNEQLNNA